MTKDSDIKPLNSVERRELNKLVDQEFEMIELQIVRLAEEERKQRIEELYEEEAEAIDAYKAAREALVAFEEEFEAQIKDWMADLQERGVEFVRNTRYMGRSVAPRPRVRIEDIEPQEPEHIGEIKNRINRDVNHKVSVAKSHLQRQKLNMQRRVTLTGLTSPEAQQFVDEIPDATTIFREALELEASDE